MNILKIISDEYREPLEYSPLWKIVEMLFTGIVAVVGYTLMYVVGILIFLGILSCVAGFFYVLFKTFF